MRPRNPAIYLDVEGHCRAYWVVDNFSASPATFKVRQVDFGTGATGPTRAELKAAGSLEKGTMRKGK